MNISIAIITHNRLAGLQGCLTALARHTRTPYTLVVADDGSTDGTRDWLIAQGIKTVSGPRRGLGWNRNRALWFLEHGTDADLFLVIEDDAWPNVDGWESQWLAAARRWGHICFSYSTPLNGMGTADNPWSIYYAGTQIVSLTRATLKMAGYSNPLFEGRYGHEDTEWRWRCGRHLGTIRDDRIGSNLRATFCLNSGIAVQQIGTFFNADSVSKNQAVLEQLRDLPAYYSRPYRDRDQYEALCAEVFPDGPKPPYQEALV